MNIEKNQAKKITRKISASLKEANTPLPYSKILEIVSSSLGYKDFNTLSALAKTKSIDIKDLDFEQRNDLLKSLIIPSYTGKDFELIRSLVFSRTDYCRDSVGWINSSNKLFSIILNILGYLRKENFTKISIQSIKDILEIKNVTNIMKSYYNNEKNLSINILNKIIYLDDTRIPFDYINSLNGYFIPDYESDYENQNTEKNKYDQKSLKPYIFIKETIINELDSILQI